MHDASLAQPEDERSVSLVEKVRFLSNPATYGSGVLTVEAIETHMSWVFLAGNSAYKLKKPVRYPFLDFSTLEARQRYCTLELSLNRRLAGDVYLRLVKLTLDPRNQLALDGSGHIVDWLVMMRRLPRAQMLDQLIAANGVDDEQCERLADVLAAFYERTEHPPVLAPSYVRRLLAEQATNRAVITRREFSIDRGRVPLLLDRMDDAFQNHGRLLMARAAGGHLVDGHGDLRPEHICLCDGVVIFDCLEFSDELRLVDPVDELAYLALECALLGDSGLGRRLADGVMKRMHDRPPEALAQLHSARRSMLRARLALSHLLDAAPRNPQKWEPLASRYLDLAEAALDRLEAAPTSGGGAAIVAPTRGASH